MTGTLLHDLLDGRAARTPDAVALTQGDRSLSYRQLADRSRAAARWLRGRGVRRGDRVLILAGNDAGAVPLLFAASRLGALYVLLSDQIRPFHLRHVLADCTPRVVVATPRAAPLVTTLGGDGDPPPVAGLDEAVWDPAPAPDVAAPDAAGPAGAAGPGTLPDAAPCLSVDPVSLIYTSGSTALPKAVVSTHRQVLFAARAIQARLGYRADDVVFCCLPLSFDYGLYQVFLACLAGARLVLGDQTDAGPPLLGRLVDQRVTVLPLVPSLAVTLCRLTARADRRPERLRLVTNTGAALTDAVSARLRALLPQVDVVAMFGLTECKRISVAEPNLYLTRPGSVGRPLPDTEVRIVGPDGTPLPPGETGELVVRGPHVMAGYWNAPELTARRFRTDPFGQPVLHTGDRCRLDTDGYLYFVGRDDDIFKQRGVRVSTTEIEGAAMDVPGVELAAALPPDDGHGSRLAVTGDLTPERLRKELADRLEEPKMPAECRVVPALPLNVNGKVDRRALRDGWDHVR
ncbi:class I adenylate-forming enzyme family protein [Micromonospora echinofusca]|uniref:AMP-binding protein n=1 Tax=Micromonospora echinofusca TaxID=47858 RepID=A0ABS3VJK6_MICEH|nr:class I adenylate-forming enzyme family protein [Micromonospora echinofusca]MBO4204633.1 AMP-binding protein [Micromonospora echinofusca]